MEEEVGFDPTGLVLASCELKSLAPTSSITKLLECPICQGVPFPPIWNCLNGHVACDQCRQQMNVCGLCRAPFSGGRNLFMEGVLEESLITCPYGEFGCKELVRGGYAKQHASLCKFGPTIKWVAAEDGNFPTSAVRGGLQNGVPLYVIRSTHAGSLTPGKLFEFVPPSRNDEEEPPASKASLAWGGGERFKHNYEVLVGEPNEVAWVSSRDGVFVPNAVIGGRSENGETLYIGRFVYEDNVINGKIHPSHQSCYIGVNGREIASRHYEVLVKVPRPRPAETGGPNGTGDAAQQDDRPHSNFYS